MNRAFVRRVAAGIAVHLKQSAPSARVIVGYDARVGSRVFAEDITRVLAGAGHLVLLYETVVTTPELAHAVVHQRAHSGLMVTASHNPPQDNGVKVYDATGAQIIAPTDEAIAQAIAGIQSLAHVVTPPLEALRQDGLVACPTPDAREVWLLAALDAVVAKAEPRRSCPLVYTALHGVAGDTVAELFQRAGFTGFHPVPTQQEPDGLFPTVEQPNPQETEALAVAMTQANRQEVDLILANDPDGDRLAVAVRAPEGTWRALTGDEVGILLADDLLRHGPTDLDRCVASSLVSTSMLGAIARAHGAERLITLTGFKWIARAGLKAERAGKRYVMGFEEAIGYNVGLWVRDKDGVTAALLVADLASRLAAQGQTLLTRLESLYRQHGYYLTTQRSFRREGTTGQAELERAMDRLREQTWTDLAGHTLLCTRDLKRRTRVTPGEAPVDDDSLPLADVLELQLEHSSRVLIRPSGTEPKLRVYAEVRQAWPEGASPEAVKADAQTTAMQLLEAVTAALGLQA